MVDSGSDAALCANGDLLIASDGTKAYFHNLKTGEMEDEDTGRRTVRLCCWRLVRMALEIPVVPVHGAFGQSLLRSRQEGVFAAEKRKIKSERM